MKRRTRCLLIAVAIVFLSTPFAVAGAESYLAVLETWNFAASGSTTGSDPHGYASLTLSEFSDTLCYSVFITESQAFPSDIQITLRNLNGETEVLFQEVETRSTGVGTLSGCVGPLSSQQKRHLKDGRFGVRLSSGLSGAVVPVGRGSDSLVLEAAHWKTIGAILELDTSQWDLLEGLLRLEPAQWEQLDGFMSADGSARISPSGSVFPVAVAPGGDGEIQFALDTSDLRNALNPAVTAADTAVKSATSGTASVVKGIGLERNSGMLTVNLNRAIELSDEELAKLHDAVDSIANFVVQLQESELAKLYREVHTTVEEGLHRGIDLLKSLRSGYDAFRTNPHDNQPDCGAGSECDRTRNRYLQLAAEFARIARGIPELAGLESDLDLNPAFLGRIIAVAPPAVLFLLDKLEGIFPDLSARATEIADLVSELVPAANHTLPATNQPLPMVLDVLDRDENESCVRFHGREERFYRLGFLLGYLELIFRMMNQGCPVDTIVGGSAEVGARATISSHPCRKVFGGIEKLLTFLRGILDSTISDCQRLGTQSNVALEANLQQCRPLPGLILPAAHGGQLEKLRSLVELRRDQVVQAGLDTGYSDAFLLESEAQSQIPQQLVAYDCLCKSYRELLRPFSPNPDNSGTGCQVKPFRQAAFRGRNDDGGEANATWKASLSNSWAQPADQNFRVRFAVQELLGERLENVRFRLEYLATRAQAQVAGWERVTRRSPFVKVSDSVFLQEGEDTTQQISTGMFILNNQGVDDRDGSVGGPSLDFSGLEVVELEFSLQLDSADLQHLDEVQLRIVAESNNRNVIHSQVPLILVTVEP